MDEQRHAMRAIRNDLPAVTWVTISASAHLGIIHDQTTIEAFETVEFLMRSVRSATKHRDAADRAGFGRGDQASRSFPPTGWTSLRPGVAGIDLLEGPAAHPLLATDVERAWLVS